MNRRCAEVIVDIRNRKVDRSFHYAVPDNLQVQLGSQVTVSFNHRLVGGTVVGFADDGLPSAKVKPIISVHGSPLPSDLIELARWMADYYICPFVQALQTVLPAPLAVRQETVVEPLVPPDDPGLSALSLLDPETGRVFLAVYKGRKPVKLKNLAARLGKDVIPKINDLAERGLVRLSSVEAGIKPKPLGAAGESLRKHQELTEQQITALKQIDLVLDQGGQTVLLHGVTGSGKTEVYLQAIGRILPQGKSALVLVPEIALTPQIHEKFAAAFPGRVAIFHSALSAGERVSEYRRVVSGQAQVVIGARSAIFAPLTNLGLIIVDEEHEQTYKQEESPKYHVREVAQKRAELCNCAVILGSATPSLESYALAVTGKYKLVPMAQRVAGRPMPAVEIVDMREELLAGNRSVFSRSLLDKLQHCLAKGEQAILFLNRRGFSTFIVCRECGYVAKCPHCDVAMTFHAGLNSLKCHYCNYSVPAPQDCPACSGRHIRYFGLGTQRVERELQELFPEVGILRMDADSTGKKGALKSILHAFQRGDAQILTGTQMVAKGLDFPNVTLVGVVAADSSLHMPDFRARERTFQLLTQVSGRAGRGKLPGQVVVQTYSPQDPSLICAQEHNYLSFFSQEIQFRRALGYPPFNHLLRCMVSGEEENRVIRCAQELGGALRQVAGKFNHTGANQLEVLGPAPSPLSKLNNRYRWQVILKGKQVLDLKSVMAQAVKDLYAFGSTTGISVSLDLDPMGIL